MRVYNTQMAKYLDKQGLQKVWNLTKPIEITTPYTSTLELLNSNGEGVQYLGILKPGMIVQ